MGASTCVQEDPAVFNAKYLENTKTGAIFQLGSKFKYQQKEGFGVGAVAAYMYCRWCRFDRC